MNAIKARDKATASRLMKAHVIEALETVLSMPDFEMKTVDNEKRTAFAAES